MLRKILHDLSDGDTSVVSERILCPEYWMAIAFADGVRRPASSGCTELSIPEIQLDAARYDIGTRGYSTIQPGDGWSWGDLAPALDKLRLAAMALRASGWPPVFVFCLDLAWELLDRLWLPMEALLGNGCVMDPSVFCWIAATPSPMRSGVSSSSNSDNGGTEPRPSIAPSIGSNFGLPHRDFTCLQALRERDGATVMLSVWLPLNDVSGDNGCMMVLPRSLDPHFAQRFEYAHMRPAMPPGTQGKHGVREATEVRFDLSCVKPLAPLKAGSLVTWAGNLIHWGTSCVPESTTPPRCSIGFNFLAGGTRPLQDGKPLLSRSDMRRCTGTAERLSLIATSLLAYGTWYDMPDSAMPSDFYCHT